ncbi:hypothetical protein ES703_112662 [subsurface metagenome]
MLDPLEQRFGKDGAAVLYIPALLGEIFWTGAIMVPLGAAFSTIIGISLVAGIMAFLMVIPPTLLAVIGVNFNWASVGAEAPAEAVLILPYVLRYAVPSIIGALGLGGVAAAVMSSVDSSVLSASSMFTWNIYKPLFNPDATDRQLKTTIRIAIVIIGTIATLLALTLKSTYTLWYFCSDLVYIMLFPSLTAALFFKKANKWGVYSAIIVALFLRFMGGIPEFGFSPIFKYWIYDAGSDVVLFPFRTMAMIAGFITLIVVSNLTQKIQPARPLKKIEI